MGPRLTHMRLNLSYIGLKLTYRKVVITTRGYYFFQDPFAAGTNKGRALLEGGYYYLKLIQYQSIFRQISIEIINSRFNLVNFKGCGY